MHKKLLLYSTLSENFAVKPSTLLHIIIIMIIPWGEKRLNYWNLIILRDLILHNFNQLKSEVEKFNEFPWREIEVCIMLSCSREGLHSYERRRRGCSNIDVSLRIEFFLSPSFFSLLLNHTTLPTHTNHKRWKSL